MMKVPPPGGRVGFQPCHTRFPTDSGFNPARVSLPSKQKRRHEHLCSWREASDATCAGIDSAAGNLLEWASLTLDR